MILVKKMITVEKLCIVEELILNPFIKNLLQGIVMEIVLHVLKNVNLDAIWIVIKMQLVILNIVNLFVLLMVQLITVYAKAIK